VNKLKLLTLAVFLSFAMATLAQEPAQPSKTSQSGASAQTPGQQLAHASNEAAEGDENAQFKHSPTVRWISSKFGISVEAEYWVLYSIDFHPSRPLSEQDTARSKVGLGIHTENIPGTDHAVRNKANDYLIDRALQASGKSYTGMTGFGTQDCAIQESMGPIADRTAEHLLACDAAIVKIRRLLLQTLKDHADGKSLPGMNPASYRVRSRR